jgi:hypothetical protein
MAPSTQRDEVYCRIVAKLASLLDMMNLKIRPTSAVLASPAITLQYSLT